MPNEQYEDDIHIIDVNSAKKDLTALINASLIDH